VCSKCLKSGLQCEWYQDTTGYYGSGSQYKAGVDNFYTFSIKGGQSSAPGARGKEEWVERESYSETSEQAQYQLNSGNKGKV
jgi:hypothetical protein